MSLNNAFVACLLINAILLTMHLFYLLVLYYDIHNWLCRFIERFKFTFAVRLWLGYCTVTWRPFRGILDITWGTTTLSVDTTLNDVTLADPAKGHRHEIGDRIVRTTRGRFHMSMEDDNYQTMMTLSRRPYLPLGSYRDNTKPSGNFTTEMIQSSAYVTMNFPRDSNKSILNSLHTTHVTVQNPKKLRAYDANEVMVNKASEVVVNSSSGVRVDTLQNVYCPAFDLEVVLALRKKLSDDIVRYLVTGKH